MMRSAAGDLNLVLAALAMLLVLSCQHNDYLPGVEPQVAARHVDIRSGPILNGALDLERTEAEAPMLLGAVVLAGTGEPVDLIGGEFRNPYYTKIEIDFGDGSGWYDATEDSKTLWVPGGPFPAGPNPTLPDHMTQHTYTIPGEYYIGARVTYWDGKVLYASERLIRVLPACGAS